MKTTLDIDDELVVKAKAFSARERKSLTALIEEGLRLRLRRSPARSRARPAALAIHRSKGGLVGGVDPLSNRSLLDAADKRSRRICRIAAGHSRGRDAGTWKGMA